jgi:hypothetical protein
MSVRQASQNILILKDDVGLAKRTTRDLPAEAHIYGKSIPRDPVGVQQCKQNLFAIINKNSDIWMDLWWKESRGP